MLLGWDRDLQVLALGLLASYKVGSDLLWPGLKAMNRGCFRHFLRKLFLIATARSIGRIDGLVKRLRYSWLFVVRKWLVSCLAQL